MYRLCCQSGEPGGRQPIKIKTPGAGWSQSAAHQAVVSSSKIRLHSRQTLPVLRPGSHQTLPVLRPGSRQTLPVLRPGSRQTLPVLRPGSRQTLPGLRPGSRQTLPGLRPGSRQTLPVLRPGIRRTLPVREFHDANDVTTRTPARTCRMEGRAIQASV